MKKCNRSNCDIIHCGKNKIETSKNDITTITEDEAIEMFYHLDFDEGMSHAEFFDAYKAGFKRGKTSRNKKNLSSFTRN